MVIEALQQALSNGLPLHTLDLSTPVKDAFVQTLFEVLPAEFSANARIQFCGPSGAYLRSVFCVKTASHAAVAPDVADY